MIFSPSKPKRPVEQQRRHSRLIDRQNSSEFHSSAGKMAIRKKIHINDWRSLYLGDIFHSLVDAPTSRVLSILFAAYLIVSFSFALLYYSISQYKYCNMGIRTFLHAFIFSIETMATLGYGYKDIHYFGNCPEVVCTLLIQMCLKLVTDAITFGVIYCRFSRPVSRAMTIIFSENAIFRRINGKLFLMMRVCELRKSQLVNVHIRLYAVRRDVAISSIDGHQNPIVTIRHFQTYPMKLTRPSFGRFAMLCTPQLIVHEIDHTSPLFPPFTFPAEGAALAEAQLDYHHSRFVSYGSCEESRSEDDKMMPDNDLERSACFRFESDDQKRERLRIEQHMYLRHVEIIVILEGIDTATRGKVQARHSYNSENIEWHKNFSECLIEDGNESEVGCSSLVVDFDCFNRLHAVPFDECDNMLSYCC